jgi:putative nucleotidyltransferase with HDIG domain
MPTLLIADLKKVPPFPAVAAKLLTLLSSNDAVLADVVELVRSDAALSARLLQYVNSPVYGSRTPVKHISHAIGLLGLDRTRQVTAIHATAGYTAHGPSNAELRMCWQHSVATAVLADQIGQACGCYTTMAFTAGILHDIGRMGLMVAFPLEYSHAIRKAEGGYFDLLAFEKDRFGMDHSQAGNMLAETWNLPTEFCDIAGRHHEDAEDPEFGLQRLIHLACRLADGLGFGLIPADEEQTIRETLRLLPTGAAKRLPRNAEDLRNHVMEHIGRIL